MNSINLLDCTLRDGGYINDWNFGEAVISDILNSLVSSGVEYIECGYLSQEKGGDPNKSQYANLNDLKKLLPEKHLNQEFAVMINFGEYDINALNNAKIDDPILRICFHKKDSDAAINYCEELIEKGYRVFVQPMASLNYTDTEFINMIMRINDINPMGFYIVDSFGVVELQEFQRLLLIADHNLSEDIFLGYHSHNNLQQAYENSKYFVEQKLHHEILLDASVYGMGRGAGNLNMELFASFLNKNYGKAYNVDAFLDIMDEDLKPIFEEHYWGYSLPFYLSAQYNCHPNYASYFAEKNTLTNKSMKQLLSSMPEDVKTNYSEEQAEKIYLDFQEKSYNDKSTLRKLKKDFSDKEILILAPGKSLVSERGKIQKFISENNPLVVAINVAPADYSCDYLVCTNEKRFSKLDFPFDLKLILTSNLAMNSADIIENDNVYVINYSSYLSDENLIADNPTLMFIKLCININIKNLYIAGFDGYQPDPRENYFDFNLSMGTSSAVKCKKNDLIKNRVKELSNYINIHFITKSLYL